MKMALPVLGLFTLIICLTFQSASGEEEEMDKLTIEPAVLAKKVGESAEFVCSNNSAINSDIVWMYTNETLIPQVRANISIVTENTLHIESAVETDGGEYICTTKMREFNATAELKVYTMPTYFTEGMIVIGINAALLVIFFMCFAYHTVKNRRHNAKLKRNAL